MESSLAVSLPVFEGPLDLLLHLIEKNKIDIYDIPIAQVTDQYMDYVRQLQNEDPDLASSFLLMAATLLEIKSRMLLPGSDMEEEEDEDPRTALVEQLTTYRIYKEAAIKLAENEIPEASWLCRDEYLPPQVADAAEPIDVDAVLDELTIRRLSEIFEEVMRRREESIDPVRSRFGRIRQEKMTLTQRMDQVRHYFDGKSRVSFKELLKDTGGGRIGAIMTFLSVLELAKEGFLFLKAGRDSRDISLTRRSN